MKVPQSRRGRDGADAMSLHRRPKSPKLAAVVSDTFDVVEASVYPGLALNGACLFRRRRASRLTSPRRGAHAALQAPVRTGCIDVYSTSGSHRAWGPASSWIESFPRRRGRGRFACSHEDNARLKNIIPSKHRHPYILQRAKNVVLFHFS